MLAAIAFFLLAWAVWVAVCVVAGTRTKVERESADPSTLAALMFDRLTRVEGVGSADVTTDSEIPTREGQP